ncbi:MAG TPA: BatA domain-containing protein [Planctomycetota bacterium]|nr:BatA domain-containing protein [Planctomycetota bacterium]
MELLFNSPAFLWGLAAAPLPLLLHLINRTRAKKVPFTALQFIEQSLAQQSIRYKLRELLLLLLRVAMLILVALLLSRPLLRSRFFSFSQKIQSTAVLVLDDTLSMSYREGERALWDRARDQALQYVDTLTDGSRVAFHPVSDEPGAFVGELDRVRRQIREWSPGSRAASCVPAVVRAGKALEVAKTGQKEILLFTDLTRVSWDGLSKASLKLPADVSLYIVDVGASRDRNASVQGIAVESTGQARVHVPLQVRATLMGGDEPTERGVDLVVAGKRVESRRVRLDRYKPATVVFRFAPEAGGLLQGSVRFSEADAMPLDDERYFSLWVRDAVRAVMSGDGKGDLFLKQALSPDGLSKRAPVVIDPAHPVELETRDLSQTDLVILSNVRSLSAPAWQKLREFVRGGGGLLVFVGDEVDPAAYTPNASQGVLPVSVREKRSEPEKTSLEASDASHPLFAPFAGGMNGDLSVRAFRTYLVLEPAPETSPRVLARFRGSSPALVERELGSGRVLMLASSADASWNDLPSYGAPYVPLMHLLVRHATGRTAAPVSTIVGESISVPLPRRHGSKARVVWTGGRAEDYVLEPDQRELLVERTLAKGNVVLSVDDALAGGFAVNVDPRESRRDRIAPAELLAGFTPESYVRTAPTLEGLERRVEKGSGSVDLYPYLITLLFLVFLGEAMYANRV